MKSSSKEPDPPHVIPIDMTPELYRRIKEQRLKEQHPIVRPYLIEFIDWLKSLKADDVYDAFESGETVHDKYKAMPFNPIRITVAAARGLLKTSSRLRSKANEALSIETARLVLRFENPKVHQILEEFDPNEEFLKKNIEAVKVIFGLVEAPPD